jgi:hypothetical protein
MPQDVDVMPQTNNEVAVTTTNNHDQEPAMRLFPDDFLADMRRRWDALQTGFVDEPRTAVKEADELVAAAVQRLSESFTSERSKLEQQWSKGNDVSTEDLRLAFRRYRSFFQRLLSV